MSSLQNIVIFLDEACQKVHELEEAAKAAIAAEKTELYVKNMRDKALYLANLAKEGEIHIASLAPAVRNRVLQQLQLFSTSAENALRLNSVFYMSALLFPEEHKAGEPNDLENFTAQLRNEL